MRLRIRVRFGLAILASVLAGGLLAGELELAQEALRDGLWEIARTHARRAGGETGNLIILESLASEQRWEAVAEELGSMESTQGDAFEYYRAVIDGDYSKALKLLKQGGAAVSEVRMHEADLQMKSGNEDAARKLWQEVLAATNVSRRAQAVAAMNLADVPALRSAYATLQDVPLKRQVGLSLGRALLNDAATAKDGAKLIRALVKDSPDDPGAREALLALADSELAGSRWQEASAIYAEAMEIWPDAAKLYAVQEGRGWAFRKLGKREEALACFIRAEDLSTNDQERARAILEQGDVLADLGRGEQSMEKYRLVVERYPKTDMARKLQVVISSREQESKGRELFKQYRFAEARKCFAEVSKSDPSRKPRMDLFAVLCLYGEGADDEAGRQATELVKTCSDDAVRAEASLWLAKFEFNRREWKTAAGLFVDYAVKNSAAPGAAEALLWSARASFADGDCKSAIQRTNELSERYPKSPFRASGLLVQSEALIELARFDEAVLVLERVAVAEGVSAADRMKAQILRADALYAMGADNSARYTAALEAYRSILFGGSLDVSSRLVVSFKLARVLEKLKRLDEAMDQYYTQVVLAYRDGRGRHERYTDEARAAFSRAAFRLADEYESRGKDRQALAVLERIAESDVPAADEAAKRMDRIMKKGRFL